MVFSKVKLCFSNTDIVILECNQVDSVDNTYLFKQDDVLRFMSSHLKVNYIEFIE